MLLFHELCHSSELVLMKVMFLELEGSSQFHGAKLTINSDEDQDTFRKVTKLNKHDSPFPAKVSFPFITLKAA